ncbi:MAG: DUF1858 domain-containing protein [Clostridia bacterium]|nr:DUF1858 domain-containing protein [Clostridia bacterium]
MITKDQRVGDLLDAHPDLAIYFLQIGMHCLGCPHSRMETIEEACEAHGVDADELLETLNRAVSA